MSNTYAGKVRAHLDMTVYVEAKDEAEALHKMEEGDWMDDDRLGGELADWDIRKNPTLIDPEEEC